MNPETLDNIKTRLTNGQAQNPDDVREMIAEVPAWTKTPPAYKENVKPCHFLTWNCIGDFFDVDVWEIRWSESDGYWMLLNGDGEEWGCIVEDFPYLADYFLILPSPPKGATDA